MSDLWTGLQEDWQTLCDILSREWESFKAFIDGIPEWWQGIVDYWTSALEEQKQNFAISWQKIKDDFAAAWESIKQAAINTWNGIKDRVTSIVNGIKTTLTNIWSGIKTTLGNIWTEITKVVTHEWDAIKNAVGIIVNGIKTKVTTTWDNIKTAVGNTLANLKEAVSTAWDNVKTSIGEKVDGIKTAVSDKFTAAKDTVLNIFNDIKSGITDKIDSAREKIAGIVDRIKNLFNFSWSLPAPKLPHITWSWTAIGGIVSIPSFGIDWYAKGGVFDSATLIGIGEKGKEAALPLNDTTYGEIARGINGHIGGDSVIDELQALREDVRNLQLVVQLDSGVIAGGVYPHIDRRMETQRRREAARR
jgi:phage-related protein